MIADEGGARDWLARLPESNPRAMDQLAQLPELLIAESQQQNLVSAASLEDLWRRHIADSAQLLDYVPRETMPWLDLGSGAGFPGLIAAILRPQCQTWLVESRPRRIDWLKRAADTLGIDNVVVLGTRLQNLPETKAAVISARAFAPLDRLLALSARFSTDDTIWLLPKGRSAQHELETLRGWKHKFHVKQSLTDPQSGIIVGTLHGPDARAGRNKAR